MRILILADNTADFAIAEHPEQIALLEEPGPRRYIALLFPRLDPSRVQLRFLGLHGANSLNAHGLFDPLAWRRLAQILRSEESELVHALSPKTALYAAIAGRLAGIPTLASIYEVRSPRKRKVIEAARARITQTILQWGIDRVVVPSELVRQNLWQMRYPRARSEVIYPGVEMRDPGAPAPAREALG